MRFLRSKRDRCRYKLRRQRCGGTFARGGTGNLGYIYWCMMGMWGGVRTCALPCCAWILEVHCRCCRNSSEHRVCVSIVNLCESCAKVYTKSATPTALCVLRGFPVAVPPQTRTCTNLFARRSQQAQRAGLALAGLVGRLACEAAAAIRHRASTSGSRVSAATSGSPACAAPASVSCTIALVRTPPRSSAALLRPQLRMPPRPSSAVVWCPLLTTAAL